MGFPGGSVIKNSPASAGDAGSIAGLGRSPERGNGNTFQYCCLGNSTDGGAWRASEHGVTKRHNLVTKTKQTVFLKQVEKIQCRLVQMLLMFES